MTVTSLNGDIGARLRRRRLELRLTQLEVARLLEVSPRTVQNWENGESLPRENGRARRALDEFLAGGIQ